MNESEKYLEELTDQLEQQQNQNMTLQSQIATQKKKISSQQSIIEKLNSENQKLGHQLQQKNEQNVMLNDSDKQLREAQKIQGENEKRKNALDSRENELRKKESEAENTISRYRALYDEVYDKNQALEKYIENAADREVSELEGHYKALENHLAEKYHKKDEELIKQYHRLLDEHSDRLDQSFEDEVKREAKKGIEHEKRKIIIVAAVICVIVWIIAVAHAHSILTYTAIAATKLDIDETDKYYDALGDGTVPISYGDKIRLVSVDSDGDCTVKYAIPGTFGHRATAYLSLKKLNKDFERR